MVAMPDPLLAVIAEKMTADEIAPRIMARTLAAMRACDMSETDMICTLLSSALQLARASDNRTVWAGQFAKVADMVEGDDNGD